jgi:hypothetical protein
MDASGVAALETFASDISEWQALKFLLPIRWLHSTDEIERGLLEVRRMALQALAESKDKPQS